MQGQIQLSQHLPPKNIIQTQFISYLNKDIKTQNKVTSRTKKSQNFDLSKNEKSVDQQIRDKIKQWKKMVDTLQQNKLYSTGKISEGDLNYLKGKQKAFSKLTQIPSLLNTFSQGSQIYFLSSHLKLLYDKIGLMKFNPNNYAFQDPRDTIDAYLESKKDKGFKLYKNILKMEFLEQIRLAICPFAAKQIFNTNQNKQILRTFTKQIQDDYNVQAQMKSNVLELRRQMTILIEFIERILKDFSIEENPHHQLRLMRIALKTKQNKLNFTQRMNTPQHLLNYQNNNHVQINKNTLGWVKGIIQSQFNLLNQQNKAFITNEKFPGQFPLSIQIIQLLKNADWYSNQTPIYAQCIQTMKRNLRLWSAIVEKTQYLITIFENYFSIHYYSLYVDDKDFQQIIRASLNQEAAQNRELMNDYLQRTLRFLEPLTQPYFTSILKIEEDFIKDLVLQERIISSIKPYFKKFKDIIFKLASICKALSILELIIYKIDPIQNFDINSLNIFQKIKYLSRLIHIPQFMQPQFLNQDPNLIPINQILMDGIPSDIPQECDDNAKNIRQNYLKNNMKTPYEYYKNNIQIIRGKYGYNAQKNYNQYGIILKDIQYTLNMIQICLFIIPQESEIVDLNNYTMLNRKRLQEISNYFCQRRIDPVYEIKAKILLSISLFKLGHFQAKIFDQSWHITLKDRILNRFYDIYWGPQKNKNPRMMKLQSKAGRSTLRFPGNASEQQQLQHENRKKTIYMQWQIHLRYNYDIHQNQPLINRYHNPIKCTQRFHDKLGAQLRKKCSQANIQPAQLFEEFNKKLNILEQQLFYSEKAHNKKQQQVLFDSYSKYIRQVQNQFKQSKTEGILLRKQCVPSPEVKQILSICQYLFEQNYESAIQQLLKLDSQSKWSVFKEQLSKFEKKTGEKEEIFKFITIFERLSYLYSKFNFFVQLQQEQFSRKKNQQIPKIIKIIQKEHKSSVSQGSIQRIYDQIYKINRNIFLMNFYNKSKSSSQQPKTENISNPLNQWGIVTKKITSGNRQQIFVQIPRQSGKIEIQKINLIENYLKKFELINRAGISRPKSFTYQKIQGKQYLKILIEINSYKLQNEKQNIFELLSIHHHSHDNQKIILRKKFLTNFIQTLKILSNNFKLNQLLKYQQNFTHLNQVNFTHFDEKHLSYHINPYFFIIDKILSGGYEKDPPQIQNKFYKQIYLIISKKFKIDAEQKSFQADWQYLLHFFYNFNKDINSEAVFTQILNIPIFLSLEEKERLLENSINKLINPLYQFSLEKTESNKEKYSQIKHQENIIKKLSESISSQSSQQLQKQREKLQQIEKKYYQNQGNINKTYNKNSKFKLFKYLFNIGGVIERRFIQLKIIPQIDEKMEWKQYLNEMIKSDIKLDENVEYLKNTMVAFLKYIRGLIAHQRDFRQKYIISIEKHIPNLLNFLLKHQDLFDKCYDEYMLQKKALIQKLKSLLQKVNKKLKQNPIKINDGKIKQSYERVQNYSKKFEKIQFEISNQKLKCQTCLKGWKEEFNTPKPQNLLEFIVQFTCRQYKGKGLLQYEHTHNQYKDNLECHLGYLMSEHPIYKYTKEFDIYIRNYTVTNGWYWLETTFPYLFESLQIIVNNPI